jgi:hypothetical protein
MDHIEDHNSVASSIPYHHWLAVLSPGCRYRPYPGRSSVRGSLQSYRGRDDCLRYCNPSPQDQTNPPCSSANIRHNGTCYHLSHNVDVLLHDVNATHFVRVSCNQTPQYTGTVNNVLWCIVMKYNKRKIPQMLHCDSNWAMAITPTLTNT